MNAERAWRTSDWGGLWSPSCRVVLCLANGEIRDLGFESIEDAKAFFGDVMECNPRGIIEARIEDGEYALAKCRWNTEGAEMYEREGCDRCGAEIGSSVETYRVRCCDRCHEEVEDEVCSRTRYVFVFENGSLAHHAIPSKSAQWYYSHGAETYERFAAVGNGNVTTVWFRLVGTDVDRDLGFGGCK